MPKVNGKKFPYTKKGKALAKSYLKKEEMEKSMAKTKMLKMMAKKKRK